jgi:high-affinity Fe2+/Pb2+ permease
MGRSGFEASLGKGFVIAYLKKKKKKKRKKKKKWRAGRVPQVVECLPSKHEALSSNTNATKNKEKEKGKIKLGMVACER